MSDACRGTSAHPVPLCFPFVFRAWVPHFLQLHRGSPAIRGSAESRVWGSSFGARVYVVLNTSGFGNSLCFCRLVLLTHYSAVPHRCSDPFEHRVVLWAGQQRLLEWVLVVLAGSHMDARLDLGLVLAVEVFQPRFPAPPRDTYIRRGVSSTQSN